MSNPWLDIPEADYVGHMSSPAVGQRPVLNRLLGEALQTARPESVLVLGCSTGNGLEHVDPGVTSRVVVVDINPTYLRRLREQLPNPTFDLDVRCGDIHALELEPDSFDLVHAGLLFEYVEWRVVLPRVARALRSGGVLSTVLQAPSDSSPAVTPTPFTSLRSLESLFRFVEPGALVEAAHDEGLGLRTRRRETLPAGKSFEVMQFTKARSLPGRVMSVRKAKADDIPSIAECLRSAFEPYRQDYTPGAFIDTVPAVSTLRERLAAMCLLVAVTDEGEVVGTVGYRLVDAGEGHLRGMAVRPESQGSGVAGQLLDAVEAELRRLGCSRISLDTTAPLIRAVSFYEKNGFRRSGRVGDFHGMPLFEFVKALK